MAIEIARWIVLCFGLFFIVLSGIMLLTPNKARATLRKAGSTAFINYAEITLRMIPAAGLILVAENSKFPDVFKIFGWFMLLTSFILYFVPRKLHYQFSNKCADILLPIYFKLISPFALLIGLLIIYSVY